jgi:hypothetical protein
MSQKRKRKPRQTIELEQLKNDPNSFLALHAEDEVLRKLETYRLYQAGYAAEDIAEAFDYARAYLYEMWQVREGRSAGLNSALRGPAPLACVASSCPLVTGLSSTTRSAL